MTIAAKRHENKLPTWVTWGVTPAVLCVTAILFWMVSQSQFAAPAAYLFDTPTQPIEAGYCLAAVQDVDTGLMGAGNFISESRAFWIKRLGDYDADFSGSLVSGRAALSRDYQRIPGQEREWRREVLQQCADKALSYGAKFTAFD